MGIIGTRNVKLVRTTGEDQRSEGSALLPAIVAIGVLAMVLAGAWSFSLDEYAKGAVRTAVEQGADVGAGAGGDIIQCERTAERALDTLLSGSLRSGVTVTCSNVGPDIVAHGQGWLPSLIPGLRRVSVSAIGVAVVQVAPEQ